jgi:hypothetical protein
LRNYVGHFAKNFLSPLLKVAEANIRITASPDGCAPKYF